DEWFVPTRLNREYLEDVWRLFFEAAVKSALPTGLSATSSGACAKAREIVLVKRHAQRHAHHVRLLRRPCWISFRTCSTRPTSRRAGTADIGRTPTVGCTLSRT